MHRDESSTARFKQQCMHSRSLTASRGATAQQMPFWLTTETGKEPCKAGSLTKLNSRFYKGSGVLLAEMGGYTWTQLCSAELWAGRGFCPD